MRDTEKVYIKQTKQVRYLAFHQSGVVVKSGTAAHYIYNQTRQFGSCNVGDTFLLEADTGAG